MTLPSLAHDVNVIEQHDPHHAWHLETSLDVGWEKLRTTGDESYFRFMLDLIHREADHLRSHEPPRNSGEGTAVNGPMPLGEKPDALTNE